MVQSFNDFVAAKDLQSIVNTFSAFIQVAPCQPATEQTVTYTGPRATYEQIKQKLAATHFYGPNALLKILDAKWDEEVYKVKEKKREIKPVVVGGGISREDIKHTLYHIFQVDHF